MMICRFDLHKAYLKNLTILKRGLNLSKLPLRNVLCYDLFIVRVARGRVVFMDVE